MTRAASTAAAGRLVGHATRRAALVRAALRRAALVSTVLAWGLLAPTAPAAAHDQLVGSDPPADAVLDEAPRTMTLEFSAELLAISATVLLAGPQGEVTLDPPVVTGASLVVGLPDGLGAGGYTLAWRVVSSDGHPIQGTVPFSVTGGPTAPPTPAPTPTASTGASAAPSATPSAEHDPVMTTAPQSPDAPASTSGGTGPVVATLAAAGLVLLVAALVLIRRARTRTARPPGDRP